MYSRPALVFPRLRAVAHGLLYIFYASWIAATVTTQDPLRRRPGLRKYDPTGLYLPDWRFFAPRPATADTHLLVRDQMADGTFTQWREVWPSQTRRLSHVFFYPTRRIEKAITDASHAVHTYATANVLPKKEDIQLSIGYLSLLNFVSNQVPHAQGAVKTQWALATSGGYDESENPDVTFLSNVHRLG